MKKLKDLPSFRDFAIMRKAKNRRIEDLAREMVNLSTDDKMILAAKVFTLIADDLTLNNFDKAKPKKQK